MNIFFISQIKFISSLYFLITLTGDDRIALGGDTESTVRNSWPITDACLMNTDVSNWLELSRRLENANGLQGYGLECILLRPTRVTKPQLDEIAQRFFIEACDQHQQKIFLSLPANNEHTTALTVLDNLLRKNTSLRGIFARINSTHRRATASKHIDPDPGVARTHRQAIPQSVPTPDYSITSATRKSRRAGYYSPAIGTFKQ